jgi:hypothetical protein
MKPPYVPAEFCSECHKPLPNTVGARKTCGPECSHVRALRMSRESRGKRRPKYFKLCAICGEEFSPRNKTHVLCPKPECRVEYNRFHQRKHKASHGGWCEGQPQMFPGDPWDTDRPVYVLGDMQIEAHHAYLGTDPLPSGPSPVPFKPARIKGVYRKEPKP